ncbi:MAG: threonine synthase [Anaerovoracaceae bacterium]
MEYKSTRGSNILMSASQAIIKGIAEDRGLYVPVELPVLDRELEDLKGLNYREIALVVLSKFLTDFTEEELVSCIEGAYDEKFEAEEIVPVKKAGEAWFIELYHGKTAAFKDMALSILPYLLTTAMKKEKEDKKIVILTATSGDTGKAALEGFANVENTEIIVFYPDEGVSQVQRKQMVSQEGNNTHVYAIRGNFDDAQTGVKRIFNDADLGRRLEEDGYKFSSANSINIGRLVPQVAYYIWSYIKLLEQKTINKGDKVNIAVPTGNFGNILAAYYAKHMGLPVNKFICASNENKVLTDFINTGTYDIRREFHVTNSPSMDILISSNLERLLYHLSDGNSGEIVRLMNSLETEKYYEVGANIKNGLKDFYGSYADENSTIETIGKMYKENGYLMDTHTAVAYKVYKDYKEETGDDTPTLIASTASAYKFAESVSEAIGLPEESDGFAAVNALFKATGIKVPHCLQDLDKKKVIHKGIVDMDKMMEGVMDSLGR